MKKIIGIGNALMDIMVPIESYQIIDEFGLPHSGMVMIDENTFEKVKVRIENIDKTYVAGGSAANTIYGCAKLGVPAAFIGKIGKDNIGDIYANDLRAAGVDPKLFTSLSKFTGCSVVFVTPDGERTFAVYLGAAAEMEESDLVKELFIGYDILHIEGYLLFNYNLVEKAMRLARSLNMKISLDLAAHNFVEDNKDNIISLLKEHVDFCFANEEESIAITGLPPVEALNYLAQFCEYAVVKLGSNGSIIKNNNIITNVDICRAKKVDTTGAGDLYASGFFYGLINGYLPERCGYFGSLLSSKVIEVFGARINNWEDILCAIKQK